jgi:hypothetical protein
MVMIVDPDNQFPYLAAAAQAIYNRCTVFTLRALSRAHGAPIKGLQSNTETAR